MPMNNRLLRPLQTPGLLDLVPGAAAAYSLRSLSRSYAGPVVTVRRSSDDAEEDFTVAEVADGTLEGFCGAGDGFVYRWWDQSGNARHAVAPADADEPRIIANGNLVTEEGKPSILFDGAGDRLLATNGIGGSGVSSFFAVVRPTIDSAVQDAVICQYAPALSPTSQALLCSVGMRDGGFFVRTYDASEVVNVGNGFDISTTDQSLISVFADVANATNSFFYNGAEEDDANIARSTVPSSGISIGARPSPLFYAAFVELQELIIYPFDLAAQRELIEGQIAWSYSQ